VVLGVVFTCSWLRRCCGSDQKCGQVCREDGRLWDLRTAGGISEQTSPVLSAASWPGLAAADVPWGHRCSLWFWERRTQSDVPVLSLPPLAPKDVVVFVQGKQKARSEHAVIKSLAWLCVSCFFPHLFYAPQGHQAVAFHKLHFPFLLLLSCSAKPSCKRLKRPGSHCDGRIPPSVAFLNALSLVAWREAD